MLLRQQIKCMGQASSTKSSACLDSRLRLFHSGDGHAHNCLAKPLPRHEVCFIDPSQVCRAKLPRGAAGFILMYHGYGMLTTRSGLQCVYACADPDFRLACYIQE